MAALDRLSLNTATVDKQLSLAESLDWCHKLGIPAIDPWRHKIHEIGIDEAARLVRASGLMVSGVCRGGMFPAGDEAGRNKALDDNRRAVDEAAALGAQCLVLVVGGLPEGSKDLTDAHQQVYDGIAELLDYARACDMPLAIEPLHPMYAADRACINTLAHALDLCDQLGTGTGVAIDVYHVWWDRDLEAQIKRAGARILGFHVCDWLYVTKDLLLDRGMMGDGVIDIARIHGWVAEAGYDGLIEVEVFSAENWWRKEPADVLQTVVQRFVDIV
jgi:sugar phosphate isomerase/epimerase